MKGWGKVGLALILSGCAAPMQTVSDAGTPVTLMPGSDTDALVASLGPPTEIRPGPGNRELWIYVARGDLPTRLVRVRGGVVLSIEHRVSWAP